MASIGDLLTKVIDAFVAIVDGFVSVLQENAQAIAELAVVGLLIKGVANVFGGALTSLKGIIPM